MAPAASYASNAEDLLIARYFPADFAGVYVDLGCYKPVDHSNTYYFYERGWRGLCVDASDYAGDYAAQRPGDTFVQAGVGDTAATLTYYTVPADPTSNTFDKSLLDRMVREAGIVYEEHQVPVRPVMDIIGQFAPSRIDLLNIDVEGMDMVVLNAFDFARYRPRVVAIEDLGCDLHNAMVSPVTHKLESLGYLMRARSYYTSIFIDPRSALELKAREAMVAHRLHLVERIRKA